MAWTAPKTWSAGETLTAANFNTHIRDNSLAAGPHLHARKTADESVSTTTLQDDDTFQLTVAANEVWQVSLSLLLVTGAGGMKSAWSFPTSGLMTGQLSGADSASAETIQHQRQTASDTPTVSYLANFTRAVYFFDGIFENAGTAGTLIFRNALTTASGTSTTKAQSTMWVVKLA